MLSLANPLISGALLIAAGLLLAALVFGISRLFEKRLARPRNLRSQLLLEMGKTSEAVLVVQEGGKIGYLNPLAREWFGAGEGHPHLERLVRRAHPPETLLALCATESKARFNLNGRIVEGTSYSIPSQDGQAMVVSIRRPQLISHLALSDDDTAHQTIPLQTFAAFTEISQVMTTSLEMDETLLAILTGVQQLLPGDRFEIAVWDAEHRGLYPHRLSGSTGSQNHLERGSHRSANSGYSGYLINHRLPLLIDDVQTYTDIQPTGDWLQAPYRSYLGAPLTMGQEVVGTLELASLVPQIYTSEEIEIIQVLAGQAAIALQNALLYSSEQKRALELSSLAQLTQAVSAVNEPQELFTRLVESFVPMLEVEILGFLLYDANGRFLTGQNPFRGVQSSVVQMTSLSIPLDSPADELIHRDELILAPDAPNDPNLQTLGLHHLALAAGIKQAILAPLASGGRFLGYLLAGNKIDATPFNQDDLRLLTILVSQAAPLIENVTLVQQSHHRTLIAETLRRIASLTGSSATLDEILNYSLLDLARLFQLDGALIYLMNEEHGELNLHRSSAYGIDVQKLEPFSCLAMADAGFHLMVTSTQRPYLDGNVLESDQPAPFYRSLANELTLQSMIVVPLVAREQSLGEIILASQRSNYFNAGALQTSITAAGQLSSAVERARLYNQTDESLRRRVDQLTALSRISRELNSTQDLSYLLEKVFDELLLTTQADCGAILLFDNDGNNFASPLTTHVKLHLGDHTGEKLLPLERWVLDSKKSLIIPDFDKPPKFKRSSSISTQDILPAHPGVRSALIVPISYQEQTAGLIHLHAKTTDRFDDTAREIAESLAMQAAIALGNANRYQEQVLRGQMLGQRVEILAKIFEASQSFQLELPLEQSLENIAYAIQGATPFSRVLISVFNPQSGAYHRLAGAGYPLSNLEQLKSKPVTPDELSETLKPDYQPGRAYFVPTQPPLESGITDEGSETWHMGDAILIPLATGKGQPMGLIKVDDPRDNLRPDRTAYEALEIFSHQASLVMESHIKLQQLDLQVKVLEHSLEQTHQAAKSAQDELVNLSDEERRLYNLKSSMEVTAKRVNASLDLVKAINRQITRESILDTFCQGLLAHLGWDFAIIAEPTTTGLRTLSRFGKLDPEIKIETLLGQRNPVQHCLQSSASLFIASLTSEPKWKKSPLLAALGAQGFICIPVSVDSQIDCAILVGSTSPLPDFLPEEEMFFDQLVQQVAIALHNLNLKRETDRRLGEVNLLLDFSRQLGSLHPTNLLETLATSVCSALSGAEAAQVLLWEAEISCLVSSASSGYYDHQPLQNFHIPLDKSVIARAFNEGQATQMDDVDFASDYQLAGDNLIAYRDATHGRLPISCLVIPLQGTAQAKPLGVLLVENFSAPAAFSPEDLALITPLTRQTALTLENTRLLQASQQRAKQLQALTDVAATISTYLQPDDLVGTLLEQLSAIMPYDTGAIWLRQNNHMFVRAARGFKDSEERVGLSVSLEDSLLMKEMLTNGNPISVGDILTDERFPKLQQDQLRSWLGLPLIATSEVIGVIALEKAEANYYTPEHIQLATTFTSQAAVALENARLYQESLSRALELIQRTQRLTMLNHLSNELSKTLETSRIYEFTLQEILQATAGSRASLILFNPSGEAWLQSETPPLTPDLPLQLTDTPLFERLRQTLGVFITDDISKEPELIPLQPYLSRCEARSLLAVSLATGEDLHGVILILSDQSRRFNSDEIELARTIANQSAVAIQNARLYAETRSLSEDLEARVQERTTQLAQEHQRTEILLRITTELTASLDLEHVLNRTIRILNEIVDAEQVSVMILRAGEKKLHHLASLGYAPAPPPRGRASPFNTHEGLAGWVIENRQMVMIPDVQKDPRWVQLPDTPSEHRSAIGVPMMVGEEALGALLFFHRQVDYFSTDKLDLAQAAANQVAIAVNNAELYRLIRDQAEDLGVMFRNQQIETSRSQAILEAVADGVLVTDVDNRITLFNASAEKILGLDRKQVIDRSLDQFMGLFGRAAQSWSETIRNWSRDPTSFQPNDLYAEQITLEDDRVVSIHLAPVRLRDDFLGTVSIFRDITHLIEVDRLKSEFVATVSHELRTPMTSIKGYVEVLLMGAAGALSEQQEHFLNIIKNNTERLAVLVNDLLDISRIEAGKATLSLQPLDLGDLAEKATAILEQRMVEENRLMQVTFAFQDNIPLVYGDSERVGQILDNLLENAYRYTDPGGLITLRISRQDDEVRIDVQDTGIGIPEELHERVFERFYRGENPYVLASYGTGLGLAIVKNLVEMHQGQIWIESSGIPGEGSTFSFTLPVFRPQKDQVSSFESDDLAEPKKVTL